MKRRLVRKLVRFDSIQDPQPRFVDMAERLAQSMALFTEEAGFRADGNESLFFARQLEFVYTTPVYVLYTPRKSRMFIPVDNSVPNWADTFTYRMYDRAGMAKIISAYGSKDLPDVTLSGKEYTGTVKPIGAKYAYSLQDIRRAVAQRMPLDSDLANAASETIELQLDEIAAIGNANYSLVGALNHPNIPLVTPTTGNWNAATPAQIVADLNKLVSSIVTTTQEVHLPDTLLLAPDRFALISQTPWSGNSDTTILAWFLANNPYIKNVDSWQRLALANAAGTGPRIFCYLRRPDILAQVIPQEFERLAPDQDGLRVEVPCHARAGGVKVMRPLACAYMDGC